MRPTAPTHKRPPRNDSERDRTVASTRERLDCGRRRSQATFTSLTGGNVHDGPHRAKELARMNDQIERIEGRVMAVNAFLVHGHDGVVLVDGMLTVTDAALVRQAIDDTGHPLAGVVVTHPHPDHYAGLAHLVGTDDVAIVATNAVDAIIRRDDRLKDEVVGPMMGDEWPSRRVFPNHTVNDGDDVRLGGLTLSVRELGPGESHVDSMWQLDANTIFAGDVAYNGVHAYLADGRWRDWLVTLDRLEEDLPDDITLYVGHGPPGGKDLLAGQRRYIETFVDAIEAHAEAIDHGDHSGVIKAMKRLLPTDSLLFLMDLSIEPTLATLRLAP
jgi:glyoxylase-like metal-dependent hydrolase (beta-lactamase superfamily II)